MKSNRKWIGCLLIVVMCICSGCSRTELESRCFPLLVVVDWQEKEQEVTYCAGFPRADNSGGSTGQTTELQVSTVQGENFKKSKWNYEEDLNKFADYNHLKVLVLGEAFVDNEDAYKAMLEYLGETEEFPRNTFVCVVADTDKLLALDEKLPQDLGTYLEEYLNQHKNKKILTLGDLLDEKENQCLELWAPYLSPEEGNVRLQGYCLVGAEKINFLKLDE